MEGKRAANAMKELNGLYQNADRKEKGRILDTLCEITKYHRKYAISLLKNYGNIREIRSKRKKKYSKESLIIIEKTWEAADYPWSERLKTMLPIWLPWLKEQLPWITPELEEEVLSISSRQIDRRLKEKKKKLSRKMYGRTKPGTLLKHHIPIKTDSWDVDEPGYMEVDLVSHSGENASGEFIYSLNMTDILTGWVESCPLIGKGEKETLNGIKKIRKAVPFEILGIDTDNGSEFINHHLFRYCNKTGIQFTRGRPYKKDDNAHIEQKNWTHIRRIMGYSRFDTDDHYVLMMNLYREKLRIMMNLFQPCVKLISKTRIGSKLKRKYEPPKSPLDRLNDFYISKNKPLPDKVEELLILRKRTNPFQLSVEIEDLANKIKTLTYSINLKNKARAVK
ncbi:MAG TPA: transposase family protein [bacterium]|jgi:hypothetical protein|nr:transposase family protein [bacterium]HOB71471.1 transposase family protein [bacterium]HOG44926.1 transposase family protein [bacterium]HPY15305.1 transposase family protein [bacterium]